MAKSEEIPSNVVPMIALCAFAVVAVILAIGAMYQNTHWN